MNDDSGLRPLPGGGKEKSLSGVLVRDEGINISERFILFVITSERKRSLKAQAPSLTQAEEYRNKKRHHLWKLDVFQSDSAACVRVE